MVMILLQVRKSGHGLEGSCDLLGGDTHSHDSRVPPRCIIIFIY